VKGATIQPEGARREATESLAKVMAPAESAAPEATVQGGVVFDTAGPARGTRSIRLLVQLNSEHKETACDSALLDWLHSRDWQQRKYIGDTDTIIDPAAAGTAKQESCDALDVAMAGIGEDSV
jgi:hypothetical protein